MILSNFNDDVCNSRHSIAGITCNGSRYLYNGWTDKTEDKSKPVDAQFYKFPCSLIMHDWMDKSKNDFCLNPKTCFITPIKDPLKNHTCFSYNKGDRLYIYIRIDDEYKTVDGGSGPKRKSIPKAIRQYFRIPQNLRVSEVPEWMARTYSKAELTSMIRLPTEEDMRSFSRLTKVKMIVMILRL